ncbi:MAG: methylmalonyl-CoA mutase family protein [Candidatus Lindowbacteria bacterium]|nr:methylmalonyl-CoA mutase family protein [Candidatus Lindowbacteria bacterium]
MPAGKNGRHQWEESHKRAKKRDSKFMTVSSKEVNSLYTPDDLGGFDYDRDLGYPGQFPFTRGVHPSMYRGQLWTMRQFAGMGCARDTNQRFHFLLDHGQTGLSVAFDMPTLMGYDSDHPFSEGEVGRCGVAIDSVEDMCVLFDGIPLNKVSTSMTINGPASVLFAFYIVTGERQGVPSEKLRGTIQNDILKEYIAQKSWLVPPEPSMRIITDIMAFAAERVPQWNTISISGYHIREAGSTALQELAFTLADGFAYVEAGIKAGLDIDRFAPRLSFFFNAHNDFFEEVAKYRAARRIWARGMREEYKAKDPRSWLMRFHTQTAGCSLTAQQPENNIVRTAYQALSAIMGGTQSLHTNSMDETYALPTEKAVRIALRTQQIIAHESGVPNVIDPLAGSYFVEALTNEMEKGACEYFEQIEKLGGVIKAIELGFFQKEIAEAAKRYQREIETKERIIVGLNDLVLENEKPEIPLLKIDPHVEQEQRERLRTLRDSRDNAKVRDTLEALAGAARGTENVMPRIVDCARSLATKGEICDVLRDVYGRWQEPKIF